MKSFYLKNKTDIPLLSEEDYLELGYMQEKKERDGNRRELTMQSSITDTDVISGPIGGIIDYGTGDELDYSITSQPKDQYSASLDRKAFYLKGLLKPTTTVIRDGKRQEIDLSDLVPGDAVVLNAGEHVPGDGEVLEAIKADGSYDALAMGTAR